MPMSSKQSPTDGEKRGPWGVFVLTFCQWLDSDFRREGLPDPSELPEQVNWQRTLPFIFLHLGCLAVFWVGFSPVAVWAAVFLYIIRMFAITGFYHRYFSHRTFPDNFHHPAFHRGDRYCDWKSLCFQVHIQRL